MRGDGEEVPKMSDVPENANAGCPGTGSENAGKTSGCAGCPNQKSCASGTGPSADPDLGAIVDRFSQVKHKVLVLSGKGGVGKSSVTVNLARALAMEPNTQVAILDVDICGPSQPRMLGVEGESVHDSAQGWTPVAVGDNLSVMSIAFLLGDRNDAVIWRGARKNGLIKQFLKDVDWGHLDWLLVDTPPGTSDEHISLVQFLLQAGALDGALVITTPQEVSLLDVRKEVSFCRKTKVPVLGVIENMSSFVCPHCACSSQLFPSTTGGAQAMCDELGLELLGRLPLDPRLALSLDKGEDFFASHADAPVAVAFKKLAKKLESLVR